MFLVLLSANDKMANKLGQTSCREFRNVGTGPTKTGETIELFCFFRIYSMRDFVGNGLSGELPMTMKETDFGFISNWIHCNSHNRLWDACAGYRYFACKTEQFIPVSVYRMKTKNIQIPRGFTNLPRNPKKYRVWEITEWIVCIFLATFQKGTWFQSWFPECVAFRFVFLKLNYRVFYRKGARLQL